MGRHIGFFILCLIILFSCSSTKNRGKVVDVSDWDGVDSVDHMLVKEMYQHRLIERIVQLSDYIDLITNTVANEESKLYYASKAKSMFADFSRVQIIDDDNLTILSIDSLFKLLVADKFTIEKMDSICVPLWCNDRLLKKEFDRVISRTQMYDFANHAFTNSLVDKGDLPIMKEMTEDGVEWMPLLGNLMLTGHFKEKSFVPHTFSFDNLDTSKLGEDIEKGLYRARIKLIDEFFDRFNGKEGRMDVDVDNSDARLNNLILLYDGKMFSSYEDSVFKEAVIMANRIISDSITINYEDSTWFARALCRARLNGKPVSFTLYLNVESRENNMYKWVITRAEGDVLKLLPTHRSDKIMLLPDDHETNFLSLYRITTEKDDYITNYAQKNYSINETTVFYSLVYNGLLDIDGVEALEFIFLQVPGYTFTIKEFERDSYNAGWLINSFKKMNDKEKIEYLKIMYNS